MATPRNPENERVSTAVRLAPDLLDRLDTAARDRSLSRNRLIEMMLTEALALLVPVEPMPALLRPPLTGSNAEPYSGRGKG